MVRKMVEKPLRETTATVLARIEERLKNFLESNDKEHKIIISKIDELSGRVNHEITSLETTCKDIEHRVTDLEKYKTETESKYKGRMELYKWISVGLGIVVAAMTLLHSLGLF